MEGRSQHRSQGEGRLELRGDQFSDLNLIDSRVPKVEKETSVFDGIDTRSAQISASGLPALADLLSLAKKLPQGASDGAAKLTAAIRAAAGLQIDVLADRETITPGQEFGVGVKAYLHNAPTAKIEAVNWTASPDWQITKAAVPNENNSGSR